MKAQLTSLVEPLRSLSWLTPDRAGAYCRILAIATCVCVAAWLALSRDGLDPGGKPLGTDFVSFWTASEIAAGGKPQDVYRPEVHYAAQRAAFSGAEIGYFAFFYPPVFLLFCLPLAAFPYLAALSVWLATTGYAYWRAVRPWLHDPRSFVAVLAFPAVLINVGHGQNGFLSAALLGGGILAMDKRPVLSGVLFGALAFKPHLAILVPVVLAARGAWKAFVAAGATALSLVALSIAVFGAETWRSFFAVAPLARRAMEEDWVGSAKMQSVFAAARLLDGSLIVAYAAQAAVALTVCVLLVALARSGADRMAQGAAFASATALATPFLLDYDLTLLAIPLAWLFSEGRRTGFLPWEKLALLAGFLLPLVSRLVATLTAIPLAPLVIAALFLLVLRRGLLEANAGPFPQLGDVPRALASSKTQRWRTT